jgi:hypothetical protein
MDAKSACERELARLYTIAYEIHIRLCQCAAVAIVAAIGIVAAALLMVRQQRRRRMISLDCKSSPRDGGSPDSKGSNASVVIHPVYKQV